MNKMHIEETYRYINESEKRLIARGFAALTIHSLNYSRYCDLSDQVNNRTFAEKYGTDSKEWEDRYIKRLKEFDSVSRKFMDKIAEKYKVYQYDNDVPYSDKWDFFFWSNRGWNGTDYIDCFKLSLNEKNPIEYNLKLVQDVKQIMMFFPDFIGCTIQYDAAADTEKISEAVKNGIDSITGKFITFGSWTGKIKWVECNNEYGFFRKGAKRKYWRLDQEELLSLIIENKNAA